METPDGYWRVEVHRVPMSRQQWYRVRHGETVVAEHATIAMTCPCGPAYSEEGRARRRTRSRAGSTLSYRPAVRQPKSDFTGNMKGRDEGGRPGAAERSRTGGLTA
jgi:hypothetical protein